MRQLLFLLTLCSVFSIAHAESLANIDASSRDIACNGSCLVAPENGELTGEKISQMLSEGDVTIVSHNEDIVISDDITWEADTLLSLVAGRDVLIDGNIVAKGNRAGLIITPNQNQDSGRYYLSGKITLLGAVPWLIIEDVEYRIIKSPLDLQNINGDLGGNFALSRDLDMKETRGLNGGAGFRPIACGSSFQGRLDGLGHVISNLSIKRPGRDSSIGLFAKVEGGAIVRNLGVVNADIEGASSIGSFAGLLDGGALIDNCYATGKVKAHKFWVKDRGPSDGGPDGWWEGGDFVGGLVGQINNATIKNCHANVQVQADCVACGGLAGISRNGHIFDSRSTGDVSGSSYVAGIVGVTHGGRIERCYAMGSIVGGYCVGGLVGQFNGNCISDCYSGSSVQGGKSVGGLIGWIHSGFIRNCFAYGPVKGPGGGLVGSLFQSDPSAVDESFWDMEASGCSDGLAGVGLSTEQMQTRKTFIGAGWDFYNVWEMEEGSYPTLRSGLIH